MGDKTQREFFDELCQGSPEENFDLAWEVIKNGQYNFGRYSTWFYLQQVAQTCGVPLNPSSLMLKDYSGSKSHRNGLLYALGRTDWLDTKLANPDYELLEFEAKELLEDFHEEYPELKDTADFFMMETALCSFKKTFRVKKGRYLGYYLDRQSEEIQRCEKDDWNGINWKVLWQARCETIPSNELSKGKPKVDKSLFSFFLEQGSHYRSLWRPEEKIVYA